MGFRIESWRLQPMELPVVWRHCVQCQRLAAFICSERFRVNAQKKVLDVWLLYRCGSCDDTWKFPVFERRLVSALDPELRASFERDDVATVWRHAFDVSRLGTYVARVELGERVNIQRCVLPTNVMHPGNVIHFEVPWPCSLRLERLLANELRLPRAEIRQREASGSLLVQPVRANALRRPVRDGQQVCFIGGW